MTTATKFLLASLLLVTACGTNRRPVYAVVAEVKAKSADLASGYHSTVQTTEQKEYSVDPKTELDVIVYGPKDEGGGRAAKSVKLPIQAFALDCLQQTPCMLDKINANTIQVGSVSAKLITEYEAFLLSIATAGAVGGVCISGVCGDAMQVASGPLLIGAGVLAIFVFSLQFAR